MIHFTFNVGARQYTYDFDDSGWMNGLTDDEAIWQVLASATLQVNLPGLETKEWYVATKHIDSFRIEREDGI